MRASRVVVGAGAVAGALAALPVFVSVLFLGIDMSGSSSGGGDGVEPVLVADAGQLGIPPMALDAYRQAATSEDACPGLHWPLLAGIGAVETNHGRYGGALPDDTGRVHPAIYGPRLDGAIAGTAVVADTDGGRLDDDPTFDRALGPMQHLPSSWLTNGRDGNGDGVADPQNLYDAARASAVHLCAAVSGSLEGAEQVRRAIFAYNPSRRYVADVLARIEAMLSPELPRPDAVPGRLVLASGFWVSETIAAPVTALVEAAAADGIELTGKGWRSTLEQVALRRTYCGPTPRDVFVMDPSECRRPVALPGTSLHEQGLAIDFDDTPGAWAWLAGHAPDHGLDNRLPSEPWHWSTTGE